MGRNALPAGEKLQMVGGAVPPTVKDFITRLAEKENRTVSQIVRQLLEESPRVKPALKQKVS